MYFSLQFYFVANRCLLTDSGHFQKEQWHLLKDTLLIGLFQKKIQTGSHQGLEDIFEKTLGFLGLSLYLWKLWIQEKKRVNPRKFCEIMVYSFFGLEISTRPKTKTDGNSTWFFLDQLITPRNSTSFLIEPWNFLMLFHFFNIPTPGICMSLGDLCSLPLSHLPLVFEFFWNGMHSIAKVGR